jgi:transposase-like protein
MANILSYEEYQEKIKGLKTADDVNGFVRDLVAPVLQEMLEGEMNNHLGYEKNSVVGNNSGNSRNGYSEKTVKTGFGAAKIQVPRDRKGEFEPVAVKKYQTTTSDIEDRIISMYAKGMTTRDIHEHMKEIYGVEVSAGMVSNITDKVLPLIQEWQSRPLCPLYPIVYLDGVHFKVHESGKIVNKCSYTALGIDEEGRKELLGIWIYGGGEGAKFWLQVLTEMKNRGVDDILICCVDGLKGFSDAIQTVYPETAIQQCIIHQVRNTMKYVPHKHKDKFCADLKTIYTAPTEEAGFASLQKVKEKWPQYQLYLKSWEEKWTELSTFFLYSAEIRKIIYTTNAVESLHHQLRKVTKTTTIFAHDESLLKLLWLAQDGVSKKWTQPIPGWSQIFPQFAILFPERVKLM